MIVSFWLMFWLSYSVVEGFSVTPCNNKETPGYAGCAPSINGFISAV
jgi:hypothetical protein